MPTIERTTLDPLRVLVVENDPGWRKDHLESLRAFGYDAYAAEPPDDAEDEFVALLKDAIDKAHHHRCHLALVDMRLRSDEDHDDTSGLDLVPSLAPTVSIIVSGYGDAKTVREALKPSCEVPRRAYDFVGKEDGPDALRKTIEEVARSVWCRRDMEYVRTDELQSASLVQRFFPQDDSVPPGEVDDVLLRLFPEAKRLKIEVAGSRRTSGVLLRQRSVVVSVLEDDHRRPVIVKLARSGRIGEERERFRRVREHFTAERYAAPQGRPIDLWDIGGIVYRLIHSDEAHPVVTFSAYYTDTTNGPDDIGRAMANFEQFWHHLYQVRPDTSQPRRKTIFAAYSQVWGPEWCDRLLKYQSGGIDSEYPDPFSQLGLPNPISWLVGKVKVTGRDEYDDSGTPDTEIAMTHGDLNGDNLFVDTRHDVWVIDYERTGFGPILQDWVELENDILTHLAEMDTTDWPEYCRLLLSLLSSTTIELPSRTRTRFAKFDKEWKSIGKLRNLAAASASTTDGRSYLWGLLLNSLFRLTLLVKERDEWEQQMKVGAEQDLQPLPRLVLGIQRCLSLAGMICHRLDHWNKGWPPRNWAVTLQEPSSDSSRPNTLDHSEFVRDVFVSYSSKDQDWVRNVLLPRLESAGLRVCIDFRDFRPGAPSVTEMEKAVQTSRRTLAVLSQNYLASDWTKFEHLMIATLDTASQQQRFVPLLKAKCDLPLRISYLTYIDLTKSRDLALSWKRLLETLAAPLSSL